MEPTSIPGTDSLRDKAAQIVAGRDYSLGSATSDDRWLLALLLEVIEWIVAPFRWLFNLTDGLPTFLRWTIVVALAVVLLLLIIHMTYSLVAAVRGPKRSIAPEQKSRRQGIDPEDLERLAYDASLKSEYITAIRYLFRACVLRLERVEKRTNRPGLTNRELIRRYRDRPTLNDPLRQLVDTIDRKWYGDEDCSDNDYNICQTAHASLCRAIGEQPNAVGA